MGCNENVIKNMANEITRNCQGQNVSVDPEFVIYMIDLLLLNPKYGKLFAKTINRNNLAYFVEECGSMVLRGGTALNILKMQFILQTNYDKLHVLIERHLDTIQKCLSPLVNEILVMDPADDEEPEFQKLFRKISIYFILASGLGNPGYIVTLKEGMAALESVFGMEDLKVFVALPRNEKLQQLNVLLGYTAGVRLFNRDCKKGGEGIPDLPQNLVDAAKACTVLLSNSLITVMQKVNTLTTAIEGVITIQNETGNVVLDMAKHDGVTVQNYTEIFDLLAFNRQYEVFIRKLLADVESMTLKADQYVERTQAVLQELHAAVKYKSAVPVQNVFPLFTKLWEVWRAMQNCMFLVSTVNRLMAIMASIQDQITLPDDIIDKLLGGRPVTSDQPLFTKLWEVWRAMQNCMFLVSTVNRLMAIMASIQDQITLPDDIIDKLLGGRPVTSDQTRVTYRPSMEDRLCLVSLPNYVCYPSSSDLLAIKQAEFLGFCALCLSVGALVPSNIKIGLIRHRNRYYGFCSVKMAARFSREPDRYVNEVLNHARNNTHLINLLNIVELVFSAKDVDDLVVVRLPKIKVFDKDIQTEAHPMDEYKQKNYSWDLWEWKRRACQWARIVNCQTHSTQTNYSHLRSEIQCQTVEPRDKCLQTNKDKGINTVKTTYFLWGLRGQRGYGQHVMDIKPQSSTLGLKAPTMTTCTWPCVGKMASEGTEPVGNENPKKIYSAESE